MFESINTPEVSRLALVIGAFTSVAYKNIYGINPGGVIVPGFIIILFLISPVWCITTLVLSFVVYFIYKRLLEQTNYKRRTPMYVLSALSLGFANLVALLYMQLGWLVDSLDSLSGTLLPAVIAFTFTKQQINKVVKGIVLTTMFTALILFAIYNLFSYFFNLDFDTLKPLYAGKEIIEFKFPFIHFYITLAVGYLIYRYKNIRPGGYMVAPIAAVLLIHPLTAIAFLLGCAIVYAITQLICRFTLIVGLKRYALALFLSTIYVWITELLFLYSDSTILPFKGSNLYVIVTIMSYVNDSILYSKKEIKFYIFVTVLAAIVDYTITEGLPELIAD
jgi:hypothetical protein